MLIIEDGSIVPNANSVVTDVEYIAYAGDRGLTIGADTATREKELILSMDYLKSIEQRMKGTRTEATQSLPEPRQNVIIFGELFASNAIPSQYKNAQMEAAAASNGQSLLTNESNKNIKLQKLDVLETEFFEGGSWSITRLERVDAALKELLIGGGSGLGRVARTL